jgi:hypothetical protein
MTLIPSKQNRVRVPTDLPICHGQAWSATMSDLIPENSPAAGLIARVKALLLQPEETWGVIETEEDTQRAIFMRHVLPLAAIGPIAMLLHGILFQRAYFGFGHGIGFFINFAIVRFVMSLVGVFVMSLVIEALAPSFGGTKDNLKAFKVAAYFPTAAWVAGAFGLLPWFGFLAILGLYSFYLLYLGLPRLMKVPQDKALGYVIVIVVLASVVLAVLSMVLFMITAPMMMFMG